MRRLAALLLLLLPGLAAAQGEVLRDQYFWSPALGRELHYDLYLPPGRSGLSRLPVIYLLHGVDGKGADWLDQGDLAQTADRLIAAHELPQAIIVMPDAGNSWYVDSPPDCGLGAMGTAIALDLPAWVESRYAARAGRAGRAVAGYSMGGFGALRFALTRPLRYAAAASMSSALWSWLTPESQMPERMLKPLRHIFAGAFGQPFEPALLVAESPLALAPALAGTRDLPPVLLIGGRHEMFDTAREQADAERVLTAAGVPVTAELTDGDHNWDNWRPMLPRVLSFLGQHLKPGEPLAAAR